LKLKDLDLYWKVKEDENNDIESKTCANKFIKTLQYYLMLKLRNSLDRIELGMTEKSSSSWN